MPTSIDLIWDTGVFYVMMPLNSDFIEYAKSDIPVKYFNRVIGFGTTFNKFIDTDGVALFCTVCRIIYVR